MKKLLLLSLIAITFMACGEDATTMTTNAQEEKTILCVDVLNKNTISELFKEAKEIVLTTERGTNYCAYTFTLNKEKHYTHLSIGAVNWATEAMLDQSVSYFTNVKALDGVGEKAYITTSGQISTLSDKNLIHVSVSANKPDIERSKLLTNDILKRMK